MTHGVPGDDMAIAENGDVYVATHPYNTIVRIAADGTRTIVSDVVGGTDLAFGPGPLGEASLYLVTDGGAFGGVADAAGSLIRLALP